MAKKVIIAVVVVVMAIIILVLFNASKTYLTVISDQANQINELKK